MPKGPDITEAILADANKVKKGQRFDPRYIDYLESDRWCCDKSPTNAHWWRFISPTSAYCKFCNSWKLFPKTVNDAVEDGVRFRQVYTKDEMKKAGQVLAEVERNKMRMTRDIFGIET